MELLPGLGLVTRERGWGAQRETAEVVNWWPQHRNRAEGVCDSLFVFVLPNLKKNVTKAPTLRNRRFYVKKSRFLAENRKSANTETFPNSKSQLGGWRRDCPSRGTSCSLLTLRPPPPTHQAPFTPSHHPPEPGKHLGLNPGARQCLGPFLVPLFGIQRENKVT